MSETKPKAGWYPHRSKAGYEKYWDGSCWTDQVRRRKKPSGSGKVAKRYYAPAEPPPAQPAAESPHARIVCQFCQTPGHVTVRRARRVTRKTATRIGAGLVTLGGSVLFTGVSKKHTVTELTCSNCGMTWDVAPG